MPLPKSLTQPLRQSQLNVGAGWRGFFAPFNQAYAVNNSATIGATIYDMSVLGKFVDTTPPAGWTDMGYITKFKFTPGSKIGTMTTGYRGAPRAKYRGEVGEKVSFDFEEMSRMALRIATGTQVFNVLKTSSTSLSAGPFSATATPAVAIGASGYSATGFTGATSGLPTLAVPAGTGAAFPAGTYIVADIDYNTATYGFVGDAGISVFQNAVTDVDFIRKTSDYVARVAQVIPAASSGLATQDALILNAPFVGGGNNASVNPGTTGPSAAAKIQQVVGFGPREGGTTITEWSAVFVLDTIDGSQILMFYPRLAPDAFTGFNSANIPGINSLQQNPLSASYEAMAFDDPLDGETVVRYGPILFMRGGISPQI